MISIIVPVYNVEKTLKRCINSILSQKYHDFELLLIDDGSKDDSGKICDEYALLDNRIRVFHQPNRGVCAARNLGLDNIKGEFVTFCDSDDWVENTWLSDYIDNYNGEDVLIQNSRWWSGDKVILERKISFNPNNNLLENIESLANINSLHIWTAMWKASIIKKHHIRFLNFQYWEDARFSLTYYKYVNSMSIIPNNKLHTFNYNYDYPTTYKEYNNLTIDWFKVKCSALNLWIELCQTKGNYDIHHTFGNAIISDLLLKLNEAYKKNIFNKDEEIKLLNYIQNEIKGKYKLKYKPLKVKIISILVELNTQLSYIFIKVLSKIS